MSESMSDMSVADLDQEVCELFGLGFLDECNKGLQNGSLFPELGELKASQAALNTVKGVATESTASVIELRVPTTEQEDELASYLTGDVELQSAQKATSETRRSLDRLEGKANLATYVGKWVSAPVETDGSIDGNYLCMTKSAVSARENRLKKKVYLQHLEKSVKDLSSENKRLKLETSSMVETIANMKTEIKYLKNVLTNQGTIGALLKNIVQTKGISFNTSETDIIRSPQKTLENSPKRSSKRKLTSECQKENRSRNISCIDQSQKQVLKYQKVDHDYAFVGSRTIPSGYDAESDNSATDSGDEEGAGICLHVSDKKVSLEFCATCSGKAKGSSGNTMDPRQLRQSHSTR